ncbi:hypothetical protein [Streptomyces sp. NPDC058664]|uniref:hypothetical protein n=1 Tax=unclassified Streptomyces TaxID=2593676 RepID=UPI003650A166
MSNNPEFRAAWSAVPDVVHAETQLRRLEEHRRALGDVLSPDLARRKVFDEAVTAMRAGAEFPDDIGQRAADAYRGALEAESEVLGLSEGITSLRYHLEHLRTTDGAETALEALGKRLTEFLGEVKKPAADLRTAPGPRRKLSSVAARRLRRGRRSQTCSGRSATSARRSSTFSAHWAMDSGFSSCGRRATSRRRASRPTVSLRTSCGP